MPNIIDFTFNPDQTSHLKVEKLTSTRAISLYSDGGESGHLVACILDNYGEVLDSLETVLIDTEPSYLDIKRISDTKAIVVYTDTENGNKATVLIININGTVITKGAQTIISSGNSAYVSVAMMTDSRAVVSFKDVDSSNGGIRCKLINIDSSDVITELSEYTYLSRSADNIISERVNDDTVLVVFAYNNSANFLSYLIRMNLDTISRIDSRSVEYGIGSYLNMSKINDNKFIIAFEDDNGRGSCRYININTAIDDITISVRRDMVTDQVYSMDIGAISENKAIFAYCGENNSQSVSYMMLDISSPTTIVKESEMLLTSGNASYVDITVMDNDNYLLSFVEDSDQGKIKRLDFDNPPETPTIEYTEGILSTDISNPLIIYNNSAPFIDIHAIDVDGEILEYRIEILDYTNNLMFGSTYDPSESIQIYGLEMNKDYKIIGYVKDKSNTDISSIVKYFRLELQEGFTNLWFEDTPTVLHDCETKSNVKGPSETLVTVEGFNKQGTHCISYRMDERNAVNRTVKFNVESDFTVEDNTFRFWYNFAFPIKLRNRDEGGITVKIFDFYDNWKLYNIGGFDTYQGGWVMMQISDYDSFVDESVDEMHWDLITDIHIATDLKKISSGEDNVYIDQLTLGSSYKVVGTGLIDLDLIAEKDAEEGWGIFNKYNEIFSLTGTIYFGNANSVRGCNIVDNSEILLLSMEHNVTDDHHSIIIQENAIEQTIVTFGHIENNKGVNGIYLLSRNSKGIFDVNGATRVNLYGCNFNNYKKISGNNNDLLVNNTEFHDCELIDNKIGEITKSAFTKSKLLISNDLLTITDCIFKDSIKAIEFDVESDASFIVENCIFSGNTTDLSNLYTDHEMIVYARGNSNPLTIENNVVILSTKTLLLTDIQAGSEVRIYTVDKDELIGQESIPGSTFEYNYNYTVNIPIYIIVHHTQFKWTKIDYILSNEDKTIQVHQIIDRNYRP